ncbi:MAG: hypothetical protein LC781_03755 [Actinobacteria bacterium]|nr:hypothetical protein [Actinomycetota bacterium]MCA1715996.1 hypothetical protein [Actinomycetota bacterium]
MYDGRHSRSEPLQPLDQTLRLEVHDPEEICRAEAELARLIRKHQHQVGNFALIPELREAAERLQRLLQQHEKGAAT